MMEFGQPTTVLFGKVSNVNAFETLLLRSDWTFRGETSSVSMYYDRGDAVE